MNRNLRLLAVAGGALVFLASQSPTPRSHALDQARQAYLLTRSDPRMAEHAGEELLRARQALRAAERAWSAGGAEEEVRTLTWVALQQVEHARNVASLQLNPDQQPAAAAVVEATDRDATRRAGEALPTASPVSLLSPAFAPTPTPASTRSSLSPQLRLATGG